MNTILLIVCMYVTYREQQCWILKGLKILDFKISLFRDSMVSSSRCGRGARIPRLCERIAPLE